MISHPARGRWKFRPEVSLGRGNPVITPRKGTLDDTISLSHIFFVRLHPARGRWKAVAISNIAPHTPQGDTDDRPALLHSFVRRSGAAAFFVKFWAVPDFFRNFSNCGSFHSFYIRIQTVSHWKFPQKSGRNFSVSGVFLCRIPCYNGNKPFQTCFSHIPLLFCLKEMIP